jgi:ribosomal protein S18 acetylase RimI-like enzyme
MAIQIATKDDIPALEALMNKAYRGDESRKGWTTEADLVAGDMRTDANHLLGLIEQPQTAILKYTGFSNEMEGCVFLQVRSGRLYLGMLSVSPQLQGAGIGKQLMRAAEEYATSKDLSSIYMRVIVGRKELIDWYARQGYRDTGEREPFEDSQFGTARVPIIFMVMQKDLV